MATVACASISTTMVVSMFLCPFSVSTVWFGFAHAEPQAAQKHAKCSRDVSERFCATQAMKNFAQWEAREERRLHKDLEQHQRGVLFLGDPPPDPTPPDTSTGVLRVPDQATGSAAPSTLRRGPRRTPFGEASGQVPAPAAPSNLPSSDPASQAAVPSLAGQSDKGKQAAESRLVREDVLAGVEASELQVPGRLSSAPAELPSRMPSHGPQHHSQHPSGTLLFSCGDAITWLREALVPVNRDSV